MAENQHDSDKFIKWLNGDLPKKEAEKLADYKKHQAILNEVDNWSVAPLNEQRSYEELQSKLSSQSNTKVVPFYQTTVFKLAASLLLVATVAIYLFVIQPTETIYTTAIGETKLVTLPDGSTVQMGASSKLGFNEDNWDENRALHISGTGYFQVKKGSDFEAQFDLGKVVVLGTAFEIKSHKDYASVKCYEGKVAVQTDKTSTELIPGEGAELQPDRIIRPFKFSRLNWSSNRSRFHSAPLYVVIQLLESQYGIVIEVGSADISKKYTGVFTHNNVDLALKTVFEPMAIKYDKNGKTVKLR